MTNNKMTKYLITAMLLGSLSLTAGDNKKTGAAGAQQLLMPVGAKMTGLSGSTIAGVSGIEAMYWNPAGVAKLEKNSEVMFFSGDGIGGLKTTYFGGAFNFGEVGVFSFSVKSLDFGDIKVTNAANPNGTGELYSPSFMTTSVGYSNSLTDRIRVGTTLNIISEKIINTGTTGFSFDVGLQYSNLGNIGGLDFAVVLKNLGPTMQYSGSNLNVTATSRDGSRGQQIFAITAADFELPSLFQFGLMYNYQIDDFNGLKFGGVFENNNYMSDTYRGSAEYSYNDLFFIRGSYMMTPQEEFSENILFGPAFGTGLKYDLGFFVMELDYSYRSAGIFDGLHNMGIVIGL